MSDARAPSVLTRLQRGLESLYRVETHVDVQAFVVDAAARDQALDGAGRRPREQLLLSASDTDLALALFMDRQVIDTLERHDPSAGLSEANFGDFCLAVEGVSHFVYAVVRAAHDRPFGALELELQAEVDKFVSCALVQGPDEAAALRERLYDDAHYADDLDNEERERYRVANDEARRYAGILDRRYFSRGRLPEMLLELRRFYRLGLRDKIRHIAEAA